MAIVWTVSVLDVGRPLMGNEVRSGLAGRLRVDSVLDVGLRAQAHRPVATVLLLNFHHVVGAQQVPQSRVPVAVAVAAQWANSTAAGVLYATLRGDSFLLLPVAGVSDQHALCRRRHSGLSCGSGRWIGGLDVRPLGHPRLLPPKPD
jgi:hypothetical protein